LEWVAPALYGWDLLSDRAGGRYRCRTAESSHSWLSIGGRQIGQPSEFAKIARCSPGAAPGLGTAPLDARPAGAIDHRGRPFLLVLKQPDLGSALVSS
jgi:cell division protein FtsW (lipid II flippase)